VARDRDLAPHNEFTYLLDRRYDTFGLFDVDETSGVIRTREVLDHQDLLDHPDTRGAGSSGRDGSSGRARC